MTRIAQISMKLVKPFGFSNGWAELALKKPPPFVPSCLMAIWLATGPPGIDWLASRPSASTVRRVVWPVKFWMTPPPTSSDGDDERQRQQDAQRRAHEVDPEVAERAPAARG